MKLDIDTLLAEYSKKLKSVPTGFFNENVAADWALFYLLRMNKGSIRHLLSDMSYFHKAFRIGEVTMFSDIDEAIWQLLHIQKYFWGVVRSIEDTEKDV